MRPALVLALAAAACGGGRPRDLRVVAWSPQDAIDGGAPIAIRFDRPVVPDELVGEPALPTAIAITPAIAWRGTWRDRQTLVVEPLSPLHASTRYRVELAGELRARAGALAFSFVHRPLAVEGIWGADPDALDPAGDLPLAFDQPVAPGDAAAHCRLAGDGGGAAIALAATSAAPALELALHPAHPLVPGAAYTLACDGLTGAGGNAPLDRPYTLAVRARPALAVARVEPAGGAVAPDGVTLAIAFTTPVTLAAARDAVTASPPIPGLDRGTLSADGTTYAVRAELASDTEYRIVVADLVDRFGQHLAAPVEARFHTATGPARLEAPRGLVALDPSAPLSVWSRDVASFTLACAPVDRARAFAIALGGEPAALAAAPRPVAATADGRWHATALELGARCGGARGLYLAELSAPGAGTTRTLADVTDLGVLVDARAGSGLIWVTSRATGQPVAGARVVVATGDGKPVAADLTGADGLIKLPGRAGADGPWLVTVEHAGDVALVVAGDGATWSFARDRVDAGEPPLAPPAGPEEPAAPAPRLSLVVHAPPVAPRVGDRLAFELEARAPSGAPVRGARVEWTLARASHPIEIGGYDDFAFGGGDPAPVIEGTGTTDAAGRLVIAARDPDPPGGGPVDYVLTAAATSDALGPAAPARLAVTAEPAALAIGLRVDAIASPGFAGARSTPGGSAETIAPAGPSPHELTAALVALGPGGVPVAASAHLTITRVERACDVVAAPGRDLARCDERRRTIAERDVALAAGAAREERIELADPGAYVVRAEARDGDGRSVVAARELWVPGAGDAAWQDDGRLAPIASRACYRAGDVARIAARAGLPHATALVAIERDGILEARVVPLAGGADAMELAVASAYAPRVRARLALVAGAQPGSAPHFATGAIDLDIDACE